MGFLSGQMKLTYIAPCKGNQDCLELWTPRRGFRIPGTSSGFLFSGTWIPDCNRSGFTELYPGFQCTGFQNSTIEKYRRFRNPNSLTPGELYTGVRIKRVSVKRYVVPLYHKKVWRPVWRVHN